MHLTAPQCYQCGYDLTGALEKCPECGWIIDSKLTYISRVRRSGGSSIAKTLLSVVLILMILAAGAASVWAILVFVMNKVSPIPAIP